MKHPRRFTAILLAVLAASALAQDAVSLKHKPKKGDISKYKMESHAKLEMGEADVTGTISLKVVNVASAGGFDSEQSIDLKVTYPGGEMPIQTTVKSSYDADGALKDVTGDGVTDETKAGEFKRFGLQDFHEPTKPVKVGDTWNYTDKASSKNGDTGATVDYKVEGAEDLAGHHVFKVHATGKQTGKADATLDATYWVDRESGLMIKSVVVLKHVEITEGLIGDTNTTLTLIE